MKSLGLAASLSDAAALAEAFGPGASIGVGVPGRDILAPAAAWLTESELLAAAGPGGKTYFLAFGNAAPAEAARIAPLIEALADVSGAGFLAACLAAPWAGRTVYQGHLFEAGKNLGDAAQHFAAALGRPVAKIPHETVRAGAAAVKRACTAAKEQGRLLALIDAIGDDDAAVITAALAGLPASGGSAWLAARPHAAEPAPPSGRLAILSTATDRTTNLQIGALRGVCEVFEMPSAAPEAAAAAAEKFARAQPGPIVITSAEPAPGLRLAAARLLAMGVQKFIAAGEDAARAVLEATESQDLVAGAAMGTLRWLHGQRATICFKPAGFGPKNLFLSEVEPQIRLNAPAN